MLRIAIPIGKGSATIVNCFYCVKCGQLTDIGRARTLFRTGYFRVAYRLGCCTACFPDSEPHKLPALGTVSS